METYSKFLEEAVPKVEPLLKEVLNKNSRKKKNQKLKRKKKMLIWVDFSF